MNRTVRTVVFLLGAAGCLIAVVVSFSDLPPFGSAFHPYRDLATAAAVLHHAANAVSSVNFDQRAIDTLGEETILLGSVMGVAALLRAAKGEDTRAADATGSVLASTRLLAYVLFAVTAVIGADVVAHGHVSPGGGFQGGVILATGLHLIYVGGRYQALERLRPLDWFEQLEAAGAVAFGAFGLAGLAVTGGFLSQFLPAGRFENLVSAGTVPLLNIAVGVEVAAGTVVLLSGFLSQAIEIKWAGE